MPKISPVDQTPSGRPNPTNSHKNTGWSKQSF